MIARLASAIGPRLSYATVVASLTAFVVLAGGAAIAANQLAKNSVGAKQLKKSAVTTAKIKKNAVTTAKIRNGAVTGAKVKDGSLGAAAFQVTGSAYSHIVFSTAGPGSVAVGESATAVPLPSATYTQLAGENDFFYGAADVTFGPTCEAERDVTLFLLADASNPTAPTIADVVAEGSFRDQKGDLPSKRVSLGPFEANSVRFEPDVDTPHTLTLVALGDCKSGSGITVSNPTIVVTGVR
jgi:hypothetical protein